MSEAHEEWPEHQLSGLGVAFSARTAVIDPSAQRELSYAELGERIERVALQLRRAGLADGARVGLVTGNGIEAIIGFLAIVKAGASAMPLNPVLTATEFDTAFAQLRPDGLLVSQDQARGTAATSAARLGVPILVLGSPVLEILGLATGGGPLPAPDPDRPALLLQTSGTTGRPKTVPLTLRNLASSARTIAFTYELDPDDATFVLMPLFHVHGLIGATLSTLVSGGCVVVPSRLRMSAFWHVAAAHGVTWFTAVPTLVAKIPAPMPNERAATPIRFARSCSSPLAPSLLASFEEAADVPLVEAYGMTEASHQMASNPLPPREHRPGTVGLATGTELQVVDESWEQAESGTAGEVVVRGPTVVAGYLDDDGAGAASFRDGWFRTGDVGALAPDGYLTLVGRVKEMINRGGEKISPREIDDVLLQHPAVDEAAAYGVSDSKYGEVVHAAVVVRDTTNTTALLVHCSEHLAAFKVPKVLRIVDSIPKGPTGKIQRAAIAKALET